MKDNPASNKSALFVIFLAGLIAGTCDFTYATIYYSLRGVPASRVWQSVAAGLLGRTSYEGGWPTVILGVGLHFLIALSAAAIFYALSRKLSWMTTWAWLCGPVYGAVIFFFLRKVVIPLSALPPPKVKPHFVWSDFLVHLFLIGLPIALIIKRLAARQT